MRKKLPTRSDLLRPACPNCGLLMSVKTRNVDKMLFWGCCIWPECNGSLDFTLKNFGDQWGSPIFRKEHENKEQTMFQINKWYLIRTPRYVHTPIEGGYLHWGPAMDHLNNKVLKCERVINGAALFEGEHYYAIHPEWVTGPFESEAEGLTWRSDYLNKKQASINPCGEVPRRTFEEINDFGLDRLLANKELVNLCANCWSSNLDFESRTHSDDETCNKCQIVTRTGMCYIDKKPVENSIVIGVRSTVNHNDCVVIGTEIETQKPGEIRIGNPNSQTVEIGGVDIKKLEQDVRAIKETPLHRAAENLNTARELLSIDQKYDFEINRILTQHQQNNERRKIMAQRLTQELQQTECPVKNRLIMMASGGAIGVSLFFLAPYFDSIRYYLGV